MEGMSITKTATETAIQPSRGQMLEQEMKDPSTAPKFGDVLEKIQSQYGAKPKPQREIKKTLGKDDFMKIMVTQMRYQDPTNPFKPEQMAAEMAQFASVEQLQNLNQNFQKMAGQNQPLERLAMTNMIGKTVTIDRERFPHTEGSNSLVSFSLPSDATEVSVAIINDAGETVLAKDLGQQKAGLVSFNWDGKKVNTLAAKSGTYMFRVDAKNAAGQSVETSSRTRAQVVGVSFEGSEPVFLVGDRNRQEKITLKNVIQIDDSSGAIQNPMSRPQAPGAAPQVVQGMQAVQPQFGGNNFISFQKGVGSSNLSQEQLSPEAKAALQQFQSQQSEARAGQAAPADSERGFPNGLQDSDDQQPPINEKGGENG
ncbi:MAG: hypothetical protein A2X94_06820 [Bdellovibrionales bacterium GWB1_55_8]|nr:MAG: hypothetical protein A2X94_06820 [Bdellovibrionales bacterium GWB1_55_8]